MQRFDARLVNDACGNKDVLMKEAFDGLFVRYEDVETELATLRTENERLMAELAVADRLLDNSYFMWDKAGGPNECKHGYAEGIPCKQCDIDSRRSRTQATQKGSEPKTEGENR